jgi:hypothetical protein
MQKSWPLWHAKTPPTFVWQVRAISDQLSRERKWRKEKKAKEKAKQRKKQKTKQNKETTTNARIQQLAETAAAEKSMLGLQTPPVEEFSIVT